MDLYGEAAGVWAESSTAQASVGHERICMYKTLQKLRSSMSANIIGAIIMLLVLFGIIVSSLGSTSFTDAFKEEYSTTTYHMADTATTLVNGDHLDAYLAGEEQAEFEQTNTYLRNYCRKMNVSLVYVICVDQSDYGRFVSVFNAVNNAVDNTSYTEWEPGYQRNTTNDEYRRKYKALYEEGSAYETVFRPNPSDGSNPHITTLVPVKNSMGTVTGILCIQRPMREMEEAKKPYVVTIIIFTFMLIIIIASFAAYFIRVQFVEPVRKVSAEATRFAKENTRGESLSNISKYDELISLARSIDTMESDMVSYIENLTAITAEKERIGAELSFARNVQANSIPHVFPAFPERSDFDIYAYMRPAKEVGGDFYNFFLIDNDHLAVMIGDVSDKGVPAALFMMVSNIIVSNRTRMGGSPAEILKFANDSICEHNPDNMFVTLWLGILELSTGKMIASNGGHDHAAVYRKDGSFGYVKTKHGIALGVFTESKYTDFEIQLQKGDKLFLYTDGVTDASNTSHEMFGLERLEETLNNYRTATPHEVLSGVRQTVDAFAAEAPQFDDLTMLCVELK